MVFGEILVLIVACAIIYATLVGVSGIATAKAVRRYREKVLRDNKLINKILKK
jgi:hypothetical protein